MAHEAGDLLENPHNGAEKARADLTIAWKQRT
jgi:hypothetical protein